MNVEGPYASLSSYPFISTQESSISSKSFLIVSKPNMMTFSEIYKFELGSTLILCHFQSFTFFFFFNDVFL